MRDGGAAAEATVGTEIPPVTKTVAFELMRVFSGYPEERSVHTNRQFAVDHGLPDAIVQGMQTYAYLLEMLVGFFGRGWFESGHVAVNFLNLVLAGDTLVARGTVVARDEVEGRTELRLDVWVENQRGVKACAGTARALL